MRMRKDEIESAGLIDEHCKWKHGEFHIGVGIFIFRIYIHDLHRIGLIKRSFGFNLESAENSYTWRWRPIFRKIDSLYSVYLI